jgi:DNA-binding response OmpR family regulator
MYKILIVEDTFAIREEVCDILIMEGYEVLEAENGKIGFEMALKENPNLIISDILMPKINGFEMFEKLQKEPKTTSIPLIFLSAKGEKEDIRAGMNLGAEDYLTKPINVNDLLNAVENKIRKKLTTNQKIIEITATLSKVLQNQKKELDNYVHLMSYELKSPKRNVSDLLVWTKEELDESNISEDSNSKIHLMGEKVERMELLLVRLEQYRNISASLFKDNLVNTHTIVKKVMDKLEVPLHITITIHNKLPTLFADEKMLEKVFEILLQNAIDYNDKKKGLITLDCEITEKDYIFSIKDNGIGIDSKYYKKVFEMFQAIEPTKSSGVGLSIVEKIILNYKGEIHVKSILNKETTFYFNLPKRNNNND